MTPHLPTELWHLMLSQHPSLSIFPQRGTSQRLKAIIEHIFLQRHEPELQRLELTIRYLNELSDAYSIYTWPCMTLCLRGLSYCKHTRARRIAYFEPIFPETAVHRSHFAQFKQDVAMIDAVARGDTSKRRQCASLFAIGGLRPWSTYCGDAVPLFELEVGREKRLAVFAWVPMFAAMLREKEVRARKDAEEKADMVRIRARKKRKVMA